MEEAICNGRDLTWLISRSCGRPGLKAYGMWVADRRNYFFAPQTLDSNRLDANVVVVKLDGKDIFCDPGAAFVPFGDAALGGDGRERTAAG